jgi:hypothetical protein
MENKPAVVAKDAEAAVFALIIREKIDAKTVSDLLKAASVYMAREKGNVRNVSERIYVVTESERVDALKDVVDLDYVNMGS